MKNSESGFTIIEILIAVVMLSFGLLGMLGATAATIRVIGDSDRMVTAAYRATQRLERLEALACDAARSGTDTQQGVDIAWTVGGTAADRTRMITLTATYPLSRGRVRVDTFEKALQCTR